MKGLGSCPGCGHDKYRMVDDGHVACRKCKAEYPVMSLLPREDVVELRRAGGVQELRIWVAGDAQEEENEDTFNAEELATIIAALRMNLNPNSRAVSERLMTLLMFDEDGRCRVCGDLAGGDLGHRCKVCF